MQTAVYEYNQHRQKKDRTPIKIGIGLHYGNLMLGIIGDEKRLDGTIVADAVNLASRIEGLTKFYGAGILMSSDVFAHLSDPNKYAIRMLDLVRVKGRRDTVSVIEIFDADLIELQQGKFKTRSNFEKAVNLYRERKFSDAAIIFNECLTITPVDTAAAIYLERANYYNNYGVPPDWEGVAEMDNK